MMEVGVATDVQAGAGHNARPTEESLAIKARNRKWRTLKTEQDRLQHVDT